VRASYFIATWSVVIALFLSLARISASLTIGDRAVESPGLKISRAEDMKLQDTEIENLLKSEPEIVYKGPLLKAFLAAYESFKEETAIPLSKKAIENYQVQFRQNNEFYLIVFTVVDRARSSVEKG
jgi:hypothetical protein